MTAMELLITIVIAGFGLNFALLLVIWNSLNNRIDKLDQRIDKLDEKVTDIDRRLCRLEGAFSSKDCCMIKDDRQLRKAE